MGNSHSDLAGNGSKPIPTSNSAGVTFQADMPLWALTVIEFSGFAERGRLAQLSKYWNRNTKTTHYYRFLCQRLAIENGLYVPVAPPLNESWETLFLELFKLRHLWKLNENNLPLSSHATSYEDFMQLNAQSEFKERFKISVFAKFRPVMAIETASPLPFEGDNRQKKLTSTQERQRGGGAGPEKRGASKSPSTTASTTSSSNSSPSRERSDNDSSSDDNNVNDENVNNANENCNEITLPLHQRLAMIRMSHHLVDNRVALKVLTEEGEWFRDKWNAHYNYHHNNGEKAAKNSFFTANFHDKEKHPNWKNFQINISNAFSAIDGKHTASIGSTSNNKMISKIHSLDALNGRVIMLTPESGLREFSFDGVLPPSCSQKYTYDLCMKRLVMDMLNGFNATAIVYGQTGSGKTFSMFGKDEKSIYGHDQSGKGIVPRACEEILQAIQRRKDLNNIDSQLTVSYVEIYGDHITDLLKNGARCSHSKVSSQRFVLNGAAEQTVENMEDIYTLLYKGEMTKRRAATAMNDRSTRAHSLFILTLKQKSFKNSDVTIQSKLFLADLGGSEQVKKSQVEAGVTREGIEGAQFSVGFEMGVHMREAVYINLGLLALKRCIEALNNRSKYIPFQDSKLTMLLSEGIGGNSKTSIIICANQHPVHSHETIMTLRFGERCSLIENSLRNNATILQQILDNIEGEIKELEADILRKERWEIKDELVVDELAEEGTIEKAAGGQEIKRVTVLVGAEEERKKLAQLLGQKEQLFGKSTLPDGTNMYHNESSSTNSSYDNLMFYDDNNMITPPTAANAANLRRKKAVLGFGKKYAELYDFGTSAYDEKLEETLDNSRFEDKVSMEELPTVLRQTKKGKKLAWAAGETLEESQEILEKKAMRLKRNKLAYSGLSA